MQTSLPNLWQLNEDAARLYQIYLAHLRMQRRFAEIIHACSQIRRYAKRGPGLDEGAFTFLLQLDAYCEIGDFEAAWRILRKWEQGARGVKLNLREYRWTPKDAWALEFYYAPLQYFRQHYHQGCALLETALDFRMRRRDIPSYELLHRIYNSDKAPSHHCRVTLFHFYVKLQKRLDQWLHWEEFVAGLHPKLFRLAEISKEELIAKPTRLVSFSRRLKAIHNQRTLSGVSNGQADLVDSPATVRKRQERIRRQREKFSKQNRSRHNELNESLRKFFPQIGNID